MGEGDRKPDEGDILKEEKDIKKVIALMSGTSCDSIDAGLCEVYPDMSVKLIQGINHPYPEHIRAKIFSASVVISA